MKRNLLFISYLLIILLIGCGGGGGESGSASSPALSYTGNTSEAVIDSSNAREIAEVAYQGGSFGSTMNLNGSAQAEENSDTGDSLAVIVSQLLNDTLSEMNLTDPSSQNSFNNAAKSASGSLSGSCGGSASYSISYDDETGDFSGSLAFNGYCAAEGTLSGSTAISGQIDLTTGKFLSVTLSFETFSAIAGSDSMTIRGTMQFSYTSTPFTVTYDTVVKDDASDKVYWWNRLALGITYGWGYKDISILGRNYHPDHGYVTLSTPVLLRYDAFHAKPSSGILLLTGKEGTSAQLTVLSDSTYQVQADTDGDGEYDWDSGTLYW